MRTHASHAPTSARRRAGLAALALALAACGDPTESTAPEGGSGANGSPGGSSGNSGGVVPSSVVGAWRYGSISPTNFWNDHTGTYSGNAYGMSDHYAFERDGSFKEYSYIYTQSYGCRTQAWTEMSGTVRFGATTFSKTVTRGKFKVADSCAASRNYERAMTAAEAAERSKSYEYALRSDAAGKTYLQILDGRYDRAQ